MRHTASFSGFVPKFNKTLGSTLKNVNPENMVKKALCANTNTKNKNELFVVGGVFGKHFFHKVTIK